MAREEQKAVRCMDCKFSYLMRSAACNPIVAECERTHERNVATVNIHCKLFKETYEKKVINEMKYL